MKREPGGFPYRWTMWITSATTVVFAAFLLVMLVWGAWDAGVWIWERVTR